MVTPGLSPRQALAQVEQRLSAAGCPDPDFDARELYEMAAGEDPRLAGSPLTAAQAEMLESLCARREAREPLQYLRGRWPFLGFELAVGPGVLCPRPDTEVVAEAAAALIAGLKTPRVLDLCAGTGCLGIGVKFFCPSARVRCLEKSPEAFGYLARNVREALPGGQAAEPVLGDLFDHWKTLAPESLDLIVSNPPYLTRAEMAALQPETAREPALALEAGEDGLDFYRAIAADYKGALRPGGALALEIGWTQAAAVRALLEQAGWCEIRCIRDYGGNDRCITARRPREIE